MGAQNSNNEPEDKPNPLLEQQDLRFAAEEKRRQEIVSSFLTGLTIGAVCVGGVWLAFKFFKPCAEVAAIVAEETMSAVN